MSKKVTVIGAGITGLLAAYYLAKNGYNVSVFEQEKYPAMRTSYANGGQISVSNSEVWTTWSNVYKGIKWMFTKDAPLLIRPQPDLNQWHWILSFLKNTILNEYGRNTIDTIVLGMSSRKLYDQLIKEENLLFDQSYCGILHFYKDLHYYQNACIVKEMYNAYKCEWDLLENESKVKQIDFALKDIKGIVGGAWTPGDWTGDIHKFCVELYKTLENKYGVKFYFNQKIKIIELVKEYDYIVVSSGIGSNELAKEVGDRLNIYPVKGYSITINNVDTNLLPAVSLLDDQAKIVTSTLGNRFRVAGTAEITGENYDIRRDRIEPLLRWVETNFPSVSTKDYSSWACLRPMTPNMMPIVRQSKKNPKVFYHTGHGHLGWTLSPATAVKLKNLIEVADDR